jgi:hypothetical protein
LYVCVVKSGGTDDQLTEIKMSDERRQTKQKEIDANLAAFLEKLPNIPVVYKGKFAILRDKEIVGYYDTVSDAINAARKLYPDERFSVQLVTDTGVNLGYYSYAVPLAAA